VFAGGGYIAFEFAHVAARAGARVTILNNDDKPLRGFDSDVVRRLLAATREAGIAVHLDTTVESVERSDSGVVVHARTPKGAQTFEARDGVLAAGRVPDLEHLNLPAAGIERTKKGVKVNEFLQSVSNPQVFAAGDCADGGGLPLTPVAGYEGQTVAANILNNNSCKPNFSGLASMVYAIPPLGQIGLTEEQAREQGLNVEVHSGDMTEWFSTRHVAAKTAYYKLVLQKAGGTVLGATILGPHAEEQINVLALAIRHGLDGKSIGETLFAYPTGSSDMEYFFK
jgi:glutathione reductase (NADPH)